MSTASEQAYRTIRAEILGGGLGPGTPLPEEHLADICGVSRTPVREALRRLEAENLVRFGQSRRAQVTDWSADLMRDAFELRGLLETHAAARAAAAITSSDLAALRACNDALAQAIAPPHPDIGGFLQHNRAFHDGVITAAGSEPLRRALAGVVEQPVLLRTARQYNEAELARSHRDHAELIEAFERRDRAWASAVMAAHIRRAAHAYAASGEPQPPLA